jgi:hypothetical protein
MGEAAPAGTGPAAFDVVDSQDPKTKWRMALRPEGVRFEAAEGGKPPVEVPRDERAARVQRLSGLLIGRVVSVLVEKKNRFFKLGREAWDALEAWYPPYTRADLVAVLKRRLSWSVTIGILYLVPAFLLPPDPELAEPGRRTVDWLSAAMGGALIAMGLVSRIAPSRLFLVLDSLWCTLLAANTSRWILAGEGTWFSYIVLYLQLGYVLDGLREFGRFAPSNMAPEEPSPGAPS